MPIKKNAQPARQWGVKDLQAESSFEQLQRKTALWVWKEEDLRLEDDIRLPPHAHVLSHGVRYDFQVHSDDTIQ